MPPRRTVLPSILVRVVLLLGLLAPGCGVGEGAQVRAAPPAQAAFLPEGDIPTDRPAVFLIRRGDLPAAAGGLSVRFTAGAGAPFFGGTTATVAVPARLEVPGQLRGSLPALAIPHDWPVTVAAAVRVQRPDGTVLDGAPLAARFLPVPPPPPATVTAIEPSLLLGGMPACFRILGSDFGAVGDPVTVEFVAVAGTPFSGGTSGTLSRPGLVTAEDVVEGSLPGDVVSAAAQARVTVHLATGGSPTSVGAIATFARERKLVAGAAMAYDHFGTDVAIDHDTAVVGARLADEPAGSAGAAFVFIRQGNAWVEQQRLRAPDGGSGDHFGTAVAISGDTIAVGAPFADASATNGGSIYVFVRTAGVWTLQEKLAASDAAAGDHLGVSVAMAGDVIAAGAPDENNAGGTDAGAVYLFRRSGTVWVEHQKLLAAAGRAGDHYGEAVALHSGTLVVGAPGADSAYTHAFDGAYWSTASPLAAPGIALGDDFGRAVDLAGASCLVGAPRGDGAATGSGCAHVFRRAAGGWTHDQALLGAGGATGDEFGWSVALDGDRALVGAREADRAAADAGAAYPFVRLGPGAWTPAPVLLADDAAASDRFGQAVDLSDCVAIIGAHLDNHAAGTDAGAAYLK